MSARARIHGSLLGEMTPSVSRTSLRISPSWRDLRQCLCCSGLCALFFLLPFLLLLLDSFDQYYSYTPRSADKAPKNDTAPPEEYERSRHDQPATFSVPPRSSWHDISDEFLRPGVRTDSDVTSFLAFRLAYELCDELIIHPTRGGPHDLRAGGRKAFANAFEYEILARDPSPSTSSVPSSDLSPPAVSSDVRLVHRFLSTIDYPTLRCSPSSSPLASADDIALRDLTLRGVF